MKTDDRFFVLDGGIDIYIPLGDPMPELRQWVDEAAKRNLEPWKLYSLRHTVRTGLSICKVAEHVAELVLNDAISDALAKRCGHALFVEAISDALAAWERRLLAIVEPAERKVVWFPQASAAQAAE
jgi:hypothetical protein